MDWLEMLSQIFEVCIIPLLAVLTTYLVKYIQVKSAKIVEESDNALIDKYTTMLADTISACVLATNQTYVESLKKQGKFDAEAQKIAFNTTLEAVLGILSDDAKEYLSEAFGDLNAYITSQIEASVNVNKIQVDK
jgi:hypothetical protein